MKPSPPPKIRIEAAIDPASAGDPVLFTLSKPNGITVTASGLTDGSGAATTTFTLNRKDPHGTYGGRVIITVNGQNYSANGSVTW